MNKMYAWIASADGDLKASLISALQSDPTPSDVTANTPLSSMPAFSAEAPSCYGCPKRGISAMWVLENDTKFLAIARTSSSGDTLVLYECARTVGNFGDVGFANEFYTTFDVLSALGGGSSSGGGSGGSESLPYVDDHGFAGTSSAPRKLKDYIDNFGLSFYLHNGDTQIGIVYFGAQWSTNYSIGILSIQSGSYEYINSIDINTSIETSLYQFVLTNGTTKKLTPALPADASSKTYTLKAVNGNLNWVEDI